MRLRHSNLFLSETVSYHRYVYKDRDSPGAKFPRGLAPRMARFTLAFLPSMMGLGSLQARSAAARSPMITCRQSSPSLNVVFHVTLYWIHLNIKHVESDVESTLPIVIHARAPGRHLTGFHTHATNSSRPSVFHYCVRTVNYLRIKVSRAAGLSITEYQAEADTWWPPDIEALQLLGIHLYSQ